jgi:hypothetical protein
MNNIRRLWTQPGYQIASRSFPGFVEYYFSFGLWGCCSRRRDTIIEEERRSVSRGFDSGQWKSTDRMENMFL